MGGNSRYRSGGWPEECAQDEQTLWDHERPRSRCRRDAGRSRSLACQDGRRFDKTSACAALDRVHIIAHRGASFDAPENTLAAAHLAWSQGADALEVDVHLTRDERLAVVHDPDLRRTAGIGRRVAEASLVELQQLDVGRWKDPRFAGETIPALEDICALIPAGKRVFVELKGGPGLLPALKRSVEWALSIPALRRDQIVIISFDLQTAEAAKRMLPGHEVCWIADAGADAPGRTLAEIARVARKAGLDGLDVAREWPLDPETVQQIRADRFKLYVWTVDDPLLAGRLVRAGVDGLTTNRPGWLRAQIQAAEGLSS